MSTYRSDKTDPLRNVKDILDELYQYVYKNIDEETEILTYIQECISKIHSYTED